MPMDPTVTDEQVRTLAAEILLRPEYAWYRAPDSSLRRLVERSAELLGELWDSLPGWLFAPFEWIWEAIRALFESAFGGDVSAVLMRLAIGAALLVLGGVVVASVVRLLREQRAVRNASRGDADAAVPTDMIAEAERLAGEGRFLEAAHYTQLSALSTLLRGQWVELARSEPNRTLRARLSSADLPPRERGEFLALLDRLESRWFRDRVEDEGLYRDWHGLHARLVALAGPPR